MRAYKNAILIAWVLFVVVKVAFSYPLPPRIFHNPFPANPNPFGEGKAQGDVEAMYRIDSQRTGLLEKDGPRGNKVSLLAPDFNPGVHTASKASPVGAGSNLFVGSDGARFYALDLDGKIKWEYAAPASFHGIHSTAAVGGNYVCFGTYHGYVVCLNRSDGSPLWIRRVGGAVGASVLIDRGRLFVSVETVEKVNGFMVALNLADGKLLWRSDYFGEQSHSSPALSEDGQLVFAGANNHYFFALRADTGELAWKADLNGEIKGTPMVYGGRVFISSWDGSLVALRVADGSEVWRLYLGGPSQSSATLLAQKDRLMISGKAGGLSVVKISDGKLLARHSWRYYDETGRFPSALALKNSVWVACGWNQLCKFSPDGMKREKEFKLGGNVTGMPWLQDGKIFVTTTTGGGLYQID